MSFVTVFTVSTMAFVLLVPALMILALTTVSPLRRRVAESVHDAVDAFSDRDERRETEPEMLPVAA
jgi:Na+-transporting methylmalonyl-CoA/oxaloacetate decarboxylase gamma subunit